MGKATLNEVSYGLQGSKVGQRARRANPRPVSLHWTPANALDQTHFLLTVSASVYASEEVDFTPQLLDAYPGAKKILETQN